ncbi:hypothetical protein [Methylobacterium sp. Leaf118]|uniref:hypothetical protein n=1 Tax=Methylobacterium sp. Leaf118 TaxID=2876562 RepID=UPI001E499E24|nr:hypothetical protein [Methylobacterium sp. Leaf118]
MNAPSARGLFRATGKRPKPVHIRDLVTGEIVKADALLREEDDFYPTPPEPTRAILAAEGPRLREFSALWEPAAGDGAMVREMQAFGLKVVASDLIDRGCGAEIRSFYEFGQALGPAILTNPPFDECNRDPGFVRHALEVLGVEYMALLLPINWVGASGRAALWAKFPPSRLYVMRWRIDFTGQGAPPMLNGWFVWDRAHRGETVLRMLDRVDVRQSSLFSNEGSRA